MVPAMLKSRLVSSDGDAMLIGKSKKVVPVYPVLASGEFEGRQVTFLEPS
jgi:hypothetical protein